MAPQASRRATVRGRLAFCMKDGARRVNSANTTKTRPIHTSRKAMKPKISTGAMAATMNCGRYCPKKVSRFSTPSTRKVVTSPVRRRSKWPGPRASACW